MAAAVAVVFRDGLAEMVGWWAEPEYSHGYLIPFIALYVLAVRIPQLRERLPAPSWWGVAFLALALLMFLFGELSAIYVIVQYAFIFTVWALAVTLLGRRGAVVIWSALVFLLFMVPLPRFIQFNLSNELQLISSQLGAGIVRLFGIPVYLEGNVIDLGSYKLQVVEACSGLRYLFPLMSFGLLCAVLFKAPVWQRALVFLSSLPITIVMNSVRIAVTGVLVNRFGTGAAEGFLHYFEGWVIFSACLVLMFLEMWALARLSKRSLDDVFDPEIPDWRAITALRPDFRPAGPLVAAFILLCAAMAASVGIGQRVEEVPKRLPLNSFPLVIGDWTGTEETLSSVVLEELKLTDYVIANYRRPTDDVPAELYVAYYDSQRKGASVHSPKACLPGGGWVIENYSQVTLAGVGQNDALPVNRAVISMGSNRVLVYYWFMQRGRLLTNEYLVKWFIFWDSMTQNRTDGSLVRVITPVPDPSQLEAADRRLTEFLKVAEPRLYYYVPGIVTPVGAPVGAPSGAIPRAIPHP